MRPLLWLVAGGLLTWLVIIPFFTRFQVQVVDVTRPTPAPTAIVIVVTPSSQQLTLAPRVPALAAPGQPVARQESQPAAQPQVVPSASTPKPTKDLGLVKNGPPPVSQAGTNETVVIHGDVDATGRCSVRVFGPGRKIVAAIGGTYGTIALSGTPEQNYNEIRAIQARAAANAGKECPLR